MSMSFERLVGLFVTDETVYEAYRAAMKPILARYGGAFQFDFRVADTLLSQTTHPINRVFIIRFPDEQSHNAFFSDPEYVAVRTQLFNASVGGSTIIARYTKPD
jgi:uncharacterized protein (DUF1330 family)